MRNALNILCVTIAVTFILAGTLGAALTPKEQLGKQLFFDTDLSRPAKVSCATCHSPSTGFADPRTDCPTSAGALTNRFGNRNSPQASYAIGGPQKLMKYNGGYAGGTFWDGRASNLVEQAKGPLLNPLEMSNPGKRYAVYSVRSASYAPLFRTVYGAYALISVDRAFDHMADAIAAYERSSEVNPFTAKVDAVMAGEADFTPMERMGMMIFHGKGGCTMCHFTGTTTGRECSGGCKCGCVYTGVCTCGPGCTCGCPQKGQVACENGCKCGCAVTGVCTCGPGCDCGCLQTDANTCAGGCACGCAFTGVCKCGPGCQCGCPSTPQVCEGDCPCGCAWTGVCNCGMGCDCGCAPGGTWNGMPLFTNHGYFNVGVPANPDNPFYTLHRSLNPWGFDWVDLGLGGMLMQRGTFGANEELGKFKVPSLRNVAKTAPYMHNGVFDNLKTVIQFYNTRDVPGAGWGPPEVDHPNIFRTGGYGNLGLTDEEVDALVAFLKCFSDGYVPES